MTNIECAITWMRDNDYGSELNDGDIVRILIDEFVSLRRDNEVIMDDYGIIDMFDQFGVNDINLLEQAITDCCGGQCLAGACEDMLRFESQNQRSVGNNAMADLIDATTGKLFYYLSSLLNTVKALSSTEIMARRLMRLTMGHERQHAIQSLEFLQEGRTAEQTQLLLVNAEDIDPIIAKSYAAVPSEMEADQIGFDFMLSFENM